MILALFGATGATGRAVTAEALRRGWAVQALVRPAASQSMPDGVTTVRGTFDNPDMVAAVVRGADAVVCVVGPRPPYRDVFCAQATAAVLAAMASEQVTRIICQTGAMIGPDRAHVGAGLRVMAWLFRHQRPAVAADRLEQERLLRSSQVRWTLIKPPRLVTGAASGQVAAGPEVKVGMRSSLRLGDLARLITDCVETGRSAGTVVYARTLPTRRP